MTGRGGEMKCKETATVISNVLEKDNCACEVTPDDDEMIVRTEMEVECDFCRNFAVLFSVRDDDVQIRCSPRMTVKAGCRSAVAEYLMQINYMLRYGKVVLDMHDGDIHYEYLKDVVAFSTNALDAVKDMVAAAQFVSEHAMPGVYKIVSGIWTAQQAIDAYEKAMDGEGKDEDDSSSDAPSGFRPLSAEDYIVNCEGPSYPLMECT